MKGVVFSLGCKVNTYEGQSILRTLAEAGIEVSDKLEPADFYVLNTCSVTAEADRKSRQAVARMLKLNPNARVYICGCSSQNDPQAYLKKPNVRFVSGVGGKGKLAEAVLADLKIAAHAAQDRTAQLPKTYEDELFPYATRTRSFIKVQDGCNNFCAYCIIPYLRGRSRSRSLESITEEAIAAAAHAKELVLTGVDISAYGKDIGSSLTALVRAFGAVDARKRLGSLECTVVSSELLYAMKESGFCDHFHLSLQSGSETVLGRMNRKYSPAYYLQAVDKIRTVFPNAGITTDVIAGFPEETEEEHKQTVAFIKTVGFSALHVFPYSERAGTVAAKMKQVPKAVRAARAAEIAQVGQSLKESFLRSQLGSSYPVYAETEEDGFTVGYTPNYIKVYTHLQAGELGRVTVQKLYKEGVIGT